MNPARRRILHLVVTTLVLASMTLSYLAPFATLYVARAQEVTPEVTTEPTPEPTPVVTETPLAVVEVTAEPTPEITSEPTLEVTVEPTVEVTPEITGEPTAEVTVVPTATPLPTLFQDDFQDSDPADWLLSGGWYVTAEQDNSNIFMSALKPNETAVIAGLDWAHFLLSARFRVAPENTAQLTFRSAMITLEANGRASLWQGDVLLAEGPAPTESVTEPIAVWRTLNVQALGSTITVGVDGVVQFTYDDPAPINGAISISTGAANAGEVAFDDVIINQLETPIVELTPEVTIEPEITPEVTEEPAVNLPLLTADFETDLIEGWTFGAGAGVIQETDTNRALQLLSGASLTPADPLYLANFQLDLRVNLAQGSLDIPFRTLDGAGYVLTFAEAGTTLGRVNAETGALDTLPTTPITHTANTWHTLSLVAEGGTFSVTVDGVLEWTAADETPVASGQIAFVANGDLLLDDIAITSLDTTELAATPTPFVLTEDTAAKLDSALVDLIELHLSGDDAGALALADEFQLSIDASSRIGVVVWAAGADASAAALLIDATGGQIDYQEGRRLEAHIPLASLTALVSTPDVMAIEVPSRAMSTSSPSAPSGSNLATGTIPMHSLNIVGANDWHAAGIRGNGVNIALIDTGFNPSGAVPSDRSCFTGIASGGAGTGAHGIHVAEVICDIAPDANVRGYQADNATELAARIAEADNTNRIIIIALDLGADVSPGDGTGGGAINSVYTNIKTARDAGVLVIASAGNNHGRYVTVAHTGSSTIPIRAFNGDRVNVSWNSWSGGSNPSSIAISGIGSGVGGGTPSETYPVSGCPASGCATNVVINGGGNLTIQVQVAGAGSINGAVANAIAGAGSLARPADSPDVLAVGAVCSSPDHGYPIMYDSSRGPIFTAGGVAPLASDGSRSTIKPDLSAPSHVDTSLNDATTGCTPTPEIPPDIFDPEGTPATPPYDGFNGTSAAAAHVAGMAALLISNPNSSMSAFDSGVGAADALQNYLQTHSADLFYDLDDLAGTATPDGFDYRYGAGLTILGSPTYDLSQAVNPPIQNISNVLYVGLGNPDSLQTGAADAPFIHISAAVAAADPGDRVVVLPGEYVTPIYLTGTDVEVFTYNSDSGFTSGNDSIVWVNSGFGRPIPVGESFSTFTGGAVFVEGENISLEGLVFRQAVPAANLFGPRGYGISAATGMEFYAATGGGVLDATFTGFLNSTPVEVTNSASVSILNNLFQDNNAGSQGAGAVLVLNSNSPSSSTPILVQGNTFLNNIMTNNPNDSSLVGQVTIEESAADIYSNVFNGNSGESLIRVNNLNTTPDNAIVNVYSNAMFYNFNAGPVVSADPAPRFRFNNNTVVGHNLNVVYTLYQGIIMRGAYDSNGLPQGTPGNGGRDIPGSRWDIRNNIFYNNGGEYATPVFDATDSSGCVSLEGGVDNGARRNWVFNSGDTGTGDCLVSFANVSFNNITSPDPLNSFAGQGLSLNPLTNPLYYQLITGSLGIDTADQSVLAPTPALVNPILFDAKGNPRVSDGDGDTIDEVEIGAFELTPLTALEDEDEFIEDTFDNLTQAFRFNLLNAVEGGFPPLTFTIADRPDNYSTVPTDFCGGTGLIIVGTFAYYCPPEHFYTTLGNPGAPGADIVPPITFDYTVSDSAASEPQTNTITLRIFEDADEPLEAGDSVQYRFLARIDEEFDFRLRPFVRFNNFRFSERNTPGLSNKADYPFQYGSVSVIDDTGEEGFNPALFGAGGTIGSAQTYLNTQVNNANALDGAINLDPEPNQLGFLRFNYTVTDANGGQVTNEIRIEVVGTIPDSGLHDDTSFNFTYGNEAGGSGSWTALYNETAINNTLHQTSVVNDTARFNFIGEGFVLYLGGTSSGGLWELQIDDRLVEWEPSPTGTAQGVITSEGIMCSTRVVVAPTTDQINGRSTTPYTVSCRNLRDGEAHQVEIIHRQARKVLQIDAFSILFDSAPLEPGFHDINEPDVLPSFVDWSLITDKKASKGIAMAVTSPTSAPTTFSFSGTGFALGTVLQGWGRGAAFAGVDYDICVTPEGGSQFCQNFNSSTGGSTSPLWGVFRPFMGFDPNGVHEVELHINSIPAGGRLIVDSITVFDQEPSTPLPLGSTDNGEIGQIVFANGSDDSWVFDARNAKASDNTLHNLNTKAVKAGPFVQFDIPDEATMFAWYRLKGKADSQNVRVCVDRGQGENGITELCRTFDLRTAPNPLILRESDFGGTWGDAWGTTSVHTVEIYSVINQTFNVDRIQVFNMTTALSPAIYDDGIFPAGAAAFNFFGGAFTSANVGAASGGALYQTTVTNAGVFARINGTGFAPIFAIDKTAGNVEICWAPGLLANGQAVLDLPDETCRTLNNFSSAAGYGVARVFVGLSTTPADFSIVIRNIQAGKTMKFDGLQVFDALPTGVITPGTEGEQRYETSFTNRAVDDLFDYFGLGWRSVTGSPARTYSGFNYDTVARNGAGIVFQTDDTNFIQLVRAFGTRNAPLEVCVDALNCQTIPNTQQLALIQLPDDGAHVISVVTTSASAFNLDAVIAFANGVPLAPGKYEDDHARLAYTGVWSNLNGSIYSAGHGKQTTALDANVLFSFNGTAFEVGAFVAVLNQMEVCYTPGIVTNPTLLNGSNCTILPAQTPLTGLKTFPSPTLAEGDYTVRIRNLVASKRLVFDYVSIFNSSEPLTPGTYQETHPNLDYVNDTNWNTEFPNASYSGKFAARTTLEDSPMIFSFEGTGFEIATPTGRFGSEIEICYEAGELTTGIDAFCYTYQNETSATFYTVTRAVNGLAHGVYSVSIRLLPDNGSLFGATRSVANTPALIVDYVTIFDNDFFSVTPGVYDDDATDASGSRLLTLSPANRWTTITGSPAAKFSGGSYAVVIDDSFRASNRYAGPMASLAVEVPANSTLTVILNTGAASTRNPERMLACFQHVQNTTPDSCAELTTMRTQQQQVFTITNDEASPAEGVVTFRALTPGDFKIDGFQVLTGGILSAGIYDNVLAATADTSIIDLSDTGWDTTLTRTAKAFGGSMLRTRTNGASFNFDFNGTGFGFVTQKFTGGMDVRVCYEALPVTDPVDANCYDTSTDIARGSFFQAGIVNYGLPEGEYRVEVTLNDSTINTRSDWFYLDAVVVFGGLSNALEPGFYDQAALPTDSAAFGPDVNWVTTVTRSGPTAGAYGLSDIGAVNSGSVAQMNVDGNGMILYQSVSTRNSNDIRICLVIEGTLANELQCSNFSQNGKTTWFTPIAFYGFGSGEHTIIFENRVPGKRFNVDAVRVLP